MADLENNQEKSSEHGGKRKGAGRKAGSATKRTREIADRIIESGDTPLEALSELRRWAMGEFRFSRDAGDFLVAAKAAEVAADWAAKEAPYVHPRLSAIEAKIDANLTVGAVLDDLDD